MGRAHDRETVSLTWGGRLGSAGIGEIWQCGVRLARPWVGSVGDAQPSVAAPDVGDLATLWESVLSAVHANTGTYLSAGAVLLWTKAAVISTVGAYEGDPTVFEGDATPGGIDTTNAGSPQDSMVITLWSGATLGRSNYGRIYLPWNVAPVSDSTAQVLPGAVASILAQAVALVGGINAWAASTWSGAHPPVVSIVHGEPLSSDSGPGDVVYGDPGSPLAWTKAVSKVKVGAIKDTQRRRRNRLAEMYSVAAV